MKDFWKTWTCSVSAKFQEERDLDPIRKDVAFTLVELLVVIAIIGILIALLLPAVQAAREAARRMSCTNNIKQIALATHNYNDVNNSLVPAGFSYANHGHYASWYQRILPFVEQQSLYEAFVNLGSGFSPARNFWTYTAGCNEAITEDTHNPFLQMSPNFNCPSIGGMRGKMYTDAGIVRYRAYYGCYSVNFGPTNYNALANADWPSTDPWWQSRGIPFRIGFEENVQKMFVTMAAVTDGLSNTVFFSEVTPPSVDPTIQNDGDTTYSDFQLVAGCGFNGYLTPNSLGPDNVYRVWTPNPGAVGRGNNASCSNIGVGSLDHIRYQSLTARSYHSGGVNAALGDGSVRFVSNTVEHKIWCYSLIGADGQSVNL
ncbi:MAG: DUF1559 domain-containing protein [Planctomycetia bacterium]|nr:DUF1559 domain-containing protein [Planctomycetia bacterium]